MFSTFLKFDFVLSRKIMRGQYVGGLTQKIDSNSDCKPSLALKILEYIGFDFQNNEPPRPIKITLN